MPGDRADHVLKQCKVEASFYLTLVFTFVCFAGTQECYVIEQIKSERLHDGSLSIE